MDVNRRKRSRMNDAGNSGDPPDVELVEEQPDDEPENEAGGNGHSTNNADRVNKQFAGCIPATVDDVHELVMELGDVAGGRVVVDRMQGTNGEFVSNVAAVDFDLLQLVDQWGPGRYRIVGRVDGERGRKWQRLVTISKPGTQARAVDGLPGSSDPRFAPPPPTYPGWPPAPPYYPAHYPPPPAQVVAAAPSADMTVVNILMKQYEQTTNLLMTLLNQKVDAANKPAMVSEMRELLNFTKDLRSLGGGSRGRGDDDDDDDGFTSALGKVGAAFLREVEHQQQQRAAVPAPAAAASHEVGTSRSPTPTSGQSPAVATVSARHTPPSQAQRHATPAPAPNSVEARIKRAAKLIIWTADDADRDPAACAGMMISILGEELAVQAVDSMSPGQLTAWLIQQIPQLDASQSFLHQVEQELRAALAPEDGAGDNPPNAPAGDLPPAGASPGPT